MIKAVNYEAEAEHPARATPGRRRSREGCRDAAHDRAGLTDSASLEHPNAIAPVSRTLNYAKDLTVDLDPYTVAVVEIRAE